MDPVLVNNLLWVMQGFLAMTFLFAGSAKLFQSPEKVAKLVPGNFPLRFLRILGALEILGAVGIILPKAVDVLPVLTPISSGCMALVLFAAAAVHIKGKEFSKLPMILVLLVLAVIVTVVQN